MSTIGSLFSGVGGFDRGLEKAGCRVVWQVEKDAKARSVLRHRWPNVELHEDVRDVGRSNLAPVDIICGGFPCQDLSVAGRRQGLDGERSGLWFEFLRIVSELAPRWVLVENVPGLRSSQGGRDLAIVLRGLAGLGYVGAWRSLDARHFGVAQRRERIFLLACRDLGAGSPAEVLAIPEGLSGHPAPGAQEGEGSAGRTQGRAGDEGGLADTLSVGANQTTGFRGDAVASALPTKYRGDPHEGTDGATAGHVVAYRKAQKARDPDDCERWEEADAAGTLGAHSPTTGHAILAHTLRSEGHDASEDGTGRGVPLVAQTVIPDRIGGWVDREDRVFAYQTDAKRSTVQEHIYHKPVGTADSLTGQQQHVLAAVPRRLTPLECERLMGWSDDWTRWGVTDEGKRVELSDSARYRMCGNGVVGTVSEWLGRRLLEALSRSAA